MRLPKNTIFPKSYETPVLKKLDPKEAQDFLRYHANLGDQGAKDILHLVNPEVKNST